jgi:hypothetical protein
LESSQFKRDESGRERKEIVCIQLRERGLALFFSLNEPFGDGGYVLEPPGQYYGRLLVEVADLRILYGIETRKSRARRVISIP